MVSLHVCTYMFHELWRTNPWDPRAILSFLKTNRLWHVLFPFARWQHCWYAQTALCIPRMRTRTLCIRRTLCSHVTIGTPMVIFCCLAVFDCFWRLVHRWYTVGTVFVDLWQLVHQWFWVFLTIGTVYTIHSKTAKRQSKQQKWPLVYQSSHVYTGPPNTQSRANSATLRDLHHTCLGSGHRPSPVGRADCMCLHDVHVSGSRSLPCAATLSSTYWWCMMSSLSTTVIKFFIFSDPTHKLSALPPELRRIR